MKIAILGFGREGQSIYKFLKRPFGTSVATFAPAIKGDAEIWILDRNANIKTPSGAKKQLGKNYLDGLGRFDLIFRSPGIPYSKLTATRILANKITSATQLFMELCPCPIIGVTGTKGKSTTATLIYKILNGCGHPLAGEVYLAGNIGHPALNLLPALNKKSLVVLELSSFQLQDLKQSPFIAVILDIFPDHLDAHKNFKEYISAKSVISKFQNSDDKVLYFSDEKYSSRAAKNGRGKKISIYHYITAGERGRLRKNISIPGTHNWRNAQAAFAVAKLLNCNIEKTLRAIKHFKGNEHRLEFVREIMGIRFYNDSASTNPQTTVAAIRAFEEPKILIAGGSDKKLNYQVWGKKFPKKNIKAVILIGENKGKIIKVLQKNGSNIAIKQVHNLKEAVKEAMGLARANYIILLSPGAASFDMFKDYADRGQKFKKLVNSL